MLNGSKQDCLSPSDVTIREYLPKYTDNSYSLIAIHTHTHVYRRPKKTFLQRRNTDVQQAHEKMFNITNYQRNANKNYHEVPPHLRKIAIFKNSTNNKCWRGCEEKVTLLPCWWEYKLVQPLQRTVQRFLIKLKTDLPYYPAIPLLGIYPEKTLIQKDTWTLIFTAALFTIAKTWRQSKCPSADEYIYIYIYIMEYYSAIKRMKCHLQQHE